VRFHSYRHAGVVGEVSEQAFEVVRPGGERTWLRYDCIFGVSYSVRLICEEPGLDRWSLRERDRMRAG